MRRNVGIRSLAIIVLLWYIMGIVGFNVHTCSASNDSFIVTFIEDMSCNAIHPEELCAPVKTCCCCCSHSSETSSHSDESIEASKCCTNEYQMLTSVADRVDETQKIINFDRLLHGTFQTYADVAADNPCLAVFRTNGPPHSFLCARNIHSAYGVWRI